MPRLHIFRTTMLYDDRIWALLDRDWTNVWFSPLPYARTKNWMACDIRRGLPFASGEFDAAFVPHVIEHVSRDQAAAFAAELRRVLAPGTILRLSTNDLQRAARQYLELVEQAASTPDAATLQHYDWAVYELIDQVTREESGGEMLKAFRRGDYDEDQVRDRFGYVFENVARPSRRWQVGRARELAYGARRRLKRRLLGDDLRQTAEATRWLWDGVSLGRLLTDAGFVDYRVVSEAESAIPGWEEYDFDRRSDGGPTEPSVYVEARRL
jgi:SAM-dependent methyltransferase